MEKKSISRPSFYKRIIPPGAALPSIPLVFLLVAFVSFLQVPANYFIRYISLSGGILLNEMLIIAGLPWALAYLLDFDRSRLFPLWRPKANLWVTAILLTMAAALLIDYATAASKMIYPIPKEYEEMLTRLMAFNGAGQFFLKLFLLCIVPGICEEIFFRGFCQNTFEARWGNTVAIVLTAVLFAILHGNPWYAHLYLLLGLFLSWVYSVSRTLIIPITCHVLNNAWTFINHSLKMEYPLSDFTSFWDIMIIAAVLLIGIFLALKLRKLRPVKSS